jgi:pimeloyl-ACP methyl ester carboxylesterase
LPPEEWAPAVIETLLTDQATSSMVDELTSILSKFHPAAMRVAIGAMAEADLRDLLPHIDVPTLLLYGDEDVRAPKPVLGGSAFRDPRIQARADTRWWAT